MSNVCYILRNDQRGKTTTIIESFISNVCYILRNNQGGKITATFESVASNTCHVVGYDCRGASFNQLIAACFYDSITIITRVIHGITLCYNDGCKIDAIIESMDSNVYHIFRYDN